MVEGPPGWTEKWGPYLILQIPEKSVNFTFISDTLSKGLQEQISKEYPHSDLPIFLIPNEVLNKNETDKKGHCGVDIYKILRTLRKEILISHNLLEDIDTFFLGFK